MITGISLDTSNNVKSTTAVNPVAENPNAETTQSATTEKQPSYDTLELSHEYDAEKVNSLKDTLTAQQTMLKERLMSMISEQTGIYNLSINNTKFQITDEEIEWAKQAIAEGGEYSVDTVATNIMDMAKALSGNNSEYISMLKDAVDMGFQQAAAIFGVELNEMPDITGETYNEIMKRFEAWEEEFNQIAETIEISVEL